MQYVPRSPPERKGARQHHGEDPEHHASIANQSTRPKISSQDLDADASYKVDSNDDNGSKQRAFRPPAFHHLRSGEDTASYPDSQDAQVPGHIGHELPKQAWLGEILHPRHDDDEEKRNDD